MDRIRNKSAVFTFLAAIWALDVPSIIRFVRICADTSIMILALILKSLISFICVGLLIWRPPN